MTAKTYSHYETPDAVAKRWLETLEAQRDVVDWIFDALDRGEITSEQARLRCKIVPGPVGDQDLEWAASEAERLGFLDET